MATSIRPNKEVLHRLAQRARLRDTRYFVGRGVYRNAFAWSPRSSSSSRICWLHGPPRIGKSSLAQAVGEDVLAEGGALVWADLIDARGDFQAALEVVIKAATLAGIDVPNGANPAQRIERLVTKKERPPLFFVIDECDRLAVQMSTDEQAFLRRIVETIGHIAFFFVSRIDPNRTVEQIADARSRLLPITNIRYLGALSQADVKLLFQRIANDLDLPWFEDASKIVWDRVGGHPQCVTAIAHELVARLDQIMGPQDIPDTIDEVRETIDPLLQSLWMELRYRTRISLLARSSAELEAEHERDALADGYFDKVPTRSYIRPAWLIEQGERLGIIPRSGFAYDDLGGSTALGLCQRMHDLLFEINRAAKRRSGGRAWFDGIEEWRRFHVPTRIVQDSYAFRSVLEHLYRTLYESARATPRHEWRLPSDILPYYVNSFGIVALVELCDLFRQSAQLERPHAHQATKHFFRFIGKALPEQPEEWSRARDKILGELHDALQMLLRIMTGGGEVITVRPTSAEQSMCITPGRPTVNILHLSDLHFGTKTHATDWHNQLAADLKHELRCMRLDLVILSGDIANYSEPAEYAAAAQFLKQLADEFGLGRDRIIIVPGNHDINWKLSKKAYKTLRREECKVPLEDGTYIEHGEKMIERRSNDLYRNRFVHFSKFYGEVRGEQYPDEYEEQATLHHFPEYGLLVLGLNSAWQIDHHFKTRASIHPQALSRALTKIRNSQELNECLKVAVWHHPLSSSGEDRIVDNGFVELLAQSGFRLGLHGHIHMAENNLFRYDRKVNGREVELVSAGTFGAPVREWVPGYPLQYNFLKLENEKITVETRCREKLNGAWKPDARWLQGSGVDPLPRYEIRL